MSEDRTESTEPTGKSDDLGSDSPTTESTVSPDAPGDVSPDKDKNDSKKNKPNRSLGILKKLSEMAEQKAKQKQEESQKNKGKWDMHSNMERFEALLMQSGALIIKLNVFYTEKALEGAKAIGSGLNSAKNATGQGLSAAATAAKSTGSYLINKGRELSDKLSSEDDSKHSDDDTSVRSFSDSDLKSDTGTEFEMVDFSSVSHVNSDNDTIVPPFYEDGPDIEDEDEVESLDSDSRVSPPSFHKNVQEVEEGTKVVEMSERPNIKLSATNPTKKDAVKVLSETENPELGGPDSDSSSNDLNNDNGPAQLN